MNEWESRQRRKGSQKAAAAAAAKSLQSCPTLCDPHRRQPTRLPRPWDSPGKNTCDDNFEHLELSFS